MAALVAFLVVLSTFLSRLEIGRLLSGYWKAFRTRLSLNCDRSRMVSTSKRVSCNWPSRSKARWRRVEERPLQRCSDC